MQHDSIIPLFFFFYVANLAKLQAHAHVLSFLQVILF